MSKILRIEDRQSINVREKYKLLLYKMYNVNISKKENLQNKSKILGYIRDIDRKSMINQKDSKNIRQIRVQRVYFLANFSFRPAV